jgi:hypothetical protein
LEGEKGAKYVRHRTELAHANYQYAMFIEEPFSRQNTARSVLRGRVSSGGGGSTCAWELMFAAQSTAAYSQRVSTCVRATARASRFGRDWRQEHICTAKVIIRAVADDCVCDVRPYEVNVGMCMDKY